MKILIIYFLLFLTINAAESLPRFRPVPLLLTLNVPVKETQQGPVFEKKAYVIYGDTFYDKPLILKANEKNIINKKSYLENSDFYDFLGDLVLKYSSVRKPEDLLSFSVVKDEVVFNNMVEENWGSILSHYNKFKSFKLRLCWYGLGGDLQALIEIVNKSSKTYTTPMHFTLTESGWRVKSGFSMKDDFLENLQKSIWIGKYESGVSIVKLPTPLPEKLSGFLISSEIIKPTEIPIDFLRELDI